MKARHVIAIAAGLSLLVLAIWQLLTAVQGLEITTLHSTDPPLTIIAPEGESQGDQPLVLVAHGLAGSTVIMRGFGLTLAHAGYTAVLWDFDGHGTNPRPASPDRGVDRLLANAEAALLEARARGYGGSGRVAILGHSMGTGAVLVYGQEHPETSATIAVSPVGQSVTRELPRNLLLMAGELESRFLRSAEERLAEAGGPGGNPADGTARKLVAIPNVEHITILFSSIAHAAARDWLDATFGPQSGAISYTDRRLLWYGLGLAGALLIGAGLAPVVTGPTAEVGTHRTLWRRLAALTGGAVGATLVLWLAGQLGLELQTLLGLQVGGYLLVWFGLAGLLAGLLLWVRPSRPSRRGVMGGLLALGVLWLGVGLLAQWVWLPWLLIPERLVRWPLGALLLVPWFLVAGQTAQGAGARGRIGWWLAHSVILVAAVILSLQLSPELGFLFLILPLFPIILAFHAMAAAPHRGCWSFAISGALFVSWLLLAVFPLQ